VDGSDRGMCQYTISELAREAEYNHEHPLARFLRSTVPRVVSQCLEIQYVAGATVHGISFITSVLLQR
jgi:hypothetical protein